ncbi:hypothetical protein C8R47DRAFT_1074152 [Mycena vitilis]|nr:hypothetical protein C8R47DRAFT_1074152 [Mycena vitilis]
MPDSDALQPINGRVKSKEAEDARNEEVWVDRREEANRRRGWQGWGLGGMTGGMREERVSFDLATGKPTRILLIFNVSSRLPCENATHTLTGTATTTQQALKKPQGGTFERNLNADNAASSPGVIRGEDSGLGSRRYYAGAMPAKLILATSLRWRDDRRAGAMPQIMIDQRRHPPDRNERGRDTLQPPSLNVEGLRLELKISPRRLARLTSGCPSGPTLDKIAEYISKSEGRKKRQLERTRKTHIDIGRRPRLTDGQLLKPVFRAGTGVRRALDLAGRRSCDAASLASALVFLMKERRDAIRWARKNLRKVERRKKKGGRWKVEGGRWVEDEPAEYAQMGALWAWAYPSSNEPAFHVALLRPAGQHVRVAPARRADERLPKKDSEKTRMYAYALSRDSQGIVGSRGEWGWQLDRG